MEKIAFVTGGSRGIGKAIAKSLAKEGFRVAINYRSRKEEAFAVKQELETFGQEALALKGNVADSSDVTRMVSEIEEAWGPVEVLVNNAGINKDNLFLRTKEQDLRDILDVNLMGAFFCAQAVTKKMTKKRWGRIINISSVVGLTGNVGQMAYSASKAAIFGMTKTLAKELSARNITVNAIAPGFIETEMTQALSDSVQDSILEQIPLKRFGKPEEIGELVAYLAKEESGYITGQTIVIDGGMSL
ncbi:3-oxoacyl-[acyl-carrier-protein] reductase [Clostridia bacterium]|nr:3-oxoacyl-[acyl-carrier-protein] reductase [Clostridia bacterium]